MWVDVTAEDLAGIPNTGNRVEYAVRRSFIRDTGIDTIWGGLDYKVLRIIVNGGFRSVPVPRRVRDKIRAANRGQPVKPFSFKLPDVLE